MLRPAPELGEVPPLEGAYGFLALQGKLVDGSIRMDGEGCFFTWMWRGVGGWGGRLVNLRVLVMLVIWGDGVFY